MSKIAHFRNLCEENNSWIPAHLINWYKSRFQTVLSQSVLNN